MGKEKDFLARPIGGGKMADHILFSVPTRDNQAVFNTSPVKKVKPMGGAIHGQHTGHVLRS